MVFERKGFAREMVSNCNVGATALGVFSGEGGSKRIVIRYAVKWCLSEKVLLGKWSAIAMLKLQRIRFAGWALTEGQLAMPRLSSGV